MIKEIIDITGLHKDRIINVYKFGSQVYGTSSVKSDIDLLVIAKTSFTDREFSKNNLNIHVVTLDKFLSDLNQHNIRNIECIMYDKIQENLKIDFKLDLIKLKHFVSHINSNSWVKSKKKITQGDYYIGIKSIFHSMRIVMFGIQLAKYGVITDFTCANTLWKELNGSKFTWTQLDKKYKEYNNSLLSEFRKLSKK